MNMMTPKARAAGRILLTGVALLGLAACDEGVTAPDPGVAAKLTVERSLIQLESLDETFEIRPSVYTVDGDPIPGAALLWSVDGEDVVEHTGEATFRSRANGNATIRVRLDPSVTALAGGPLEATVHVVVAQRPVVLVLASTMGTGSGEATIRLGALGQTVTVGARAVDARGNPVPEAPLEIMWSVGDPGITALEDGGTLRALSDGTTALRARAGGLEGTVTVEVAATLDLRACASFGASEPAADACSDRTLTVQMGG